MEQVTYRSPVEVFFELLQNPYGIAFAGLSGSASAILVANRAIKLWSAISDARIRHAEADKAVVELAVATEEAKAAVYSIRVADAEARLKEAEAHQAAAQARLLESEVALKLQAHEIISAEAAVMKAIYSADLASAGTPNSARSAEGLLQRVGQATEGLSSVSDMRLLTQRSDAI